MVGEIYIQGAEIKKGNGWKVNIRIRKSQGANKQWIQANEKSIGQFKAIKKKRVARTNSKSFCQRRLKITLRTSLSSIGRAWFRSGRIGFKCLKIRSTSFKTIAKGHIKWFQLSIKGSIRFNIEYTGQGRIRILGKKLLTA